MKMKRGESVMILATKFDEQPPEIHVINKGNNAYLWVGGKNGPCYARLSGRAALRRLAREILKALDN